MPYSSESGKPIIKAVLQRLDKFTKAETPTPFKALDIGAGSATYPKLVNPLISRPIEWTGIEIWEPYVEQFELHKHYKHLHVKDAYSVLYDMLKTTGGQACPRASVFDFIFIGDVLEHMDRSTALAVIGIAKALLAPRGVLFVSVPIGEYPQGEYLGNPHEAHVDTWGTIDELYSGVDSLLPAWVTHDGTLATGHADPGVRTERATKVVHDSEIGVAVHTSREVFKVLAPRIAAYLICKDEERFIERCMHSLDEVKLVVAVDTGSTDSTLAKLQLLADNPDYEPEVHIHSLAVSPWRFDDARNAALSFVPANFDLCISIDADETLEADFVQIISSAWWDSFWECKPLTRVYHSFMTHWNWDKPEEAPNVSSHYHERVHARLGYRWIHPVHEKLVAEAEVACWRTEALMKQQPDTSKSRSSYLPMLEQAVKEDPTDWKLWSFLSGDQAAIGRVDEALASLDTCAKQPDADIPFICWRKASLYEWQGNFRKAKAELEKAIELKPIREAYVLLAELQDRQGERSESAWEAAYQCKTPTQGYMRRESLWAPEWELEHAPTPKEDTVSQLLKLYESNRITAEEYVTVMNTLGVSIDLQTFLTAEGKAQ